MIRARQFGGPFLFDPMLEMGQKLKQGQQGLQRAVMTNANLPQRGRQLNLKVKKMHLRRLLGVIACLSIIGSTALSQALQFKQLGEFWQRDTLIGTLIREPALRIRLAPSASDENAICFDSAPKQMRRSLYSCPSNLNAFQLVDEFRLDLMTVEFLSDPDHEVTLKSISDAKRAIKLANGREFPAFDVVLIVAHYHLAYLDYLHGNEPSMRQNFESVQVIVKSTEIDLPESGLIGFLDEFGT